MGSLELVSFVPLISCLTGLLILLGSALPGVGTGRILARMGLLFSLGLILNGLFSQNLNRSDAPLMAGPVSLQEADPVTLLWLLGVTGGALLLYCWPTDRSEPVARTRWESLTGMLALAACQSAALLAHPWWQWGAVALSGWLFCLQQELLNDHDACGQRPSPRSSLIWFALADLSWFFGLRVLLTALPLLPISKLTSTDLLHALVEEDRSLVSTAATVFLFSLTIRCALFPLMTWTQSLATTGRRAAWVILLGIGTGLLLLAKWHPLITEFREPRMLLVGLGGLSACLLALVAWGTVSFPQAIVRLAGLQMGLIGIGLAPGIEAGMLWLATGLSSLILLLVISLASDRHGASKQKFPPVIIAAAALLCCGLLGQERLADPHRLTDLLDGHLPRMILAMLLLGQALASFALFRRIFSEQPAPGDATNQVIHNTTAPVSETACSLLGILGAIGLMLVPFALSGSWGLTAPVIQLVVAAIGLVAAWTWPAVPYVEKPPERGLIDSLQRLGREDLYLAVIFGRFSQGVERSLDWLHRLVDKRLIPLLTQRVRHGLAALSEAATLTDELSTGRTAVVQMLIAMAVLTAGIVLSGAF